MNLEEIARASNVSKAAVSLALNNKPGISEETRKRILEVVRTSGYKHRSMVDSGVEGTGRPAPKLIRLVGCVKEDLVSRQYQSTSFFADLIRSIERYARKAGYALVFSYLDRDNFVEALGAVERDHPSTGILVLGTNLTPVDIQSILESHPLCVIIDTLFEFMDADFVVMDNVLGGYCAARHLARTLGHTRIGYVEATENLANFANRKRGFMTAMDELGLHVLPRDLFHVASEIVQAKAEFSRQSRGCEDMPTALFCECDYIAIGVIQSLREAGIRVPEDVSVMGFDNVAEATIVQPALTTMSVPRDKIGEVAVRHLIHMCDSGEIHYMKSLINTAVVSRGSCAPLIS